MSSESKQRSEGYESLFAILIGISAALSGLGGFLAADASSQANTAGNDSIMWHSEATAAQTRAYQLIIRDDQLLTQASIEDSIGTSTNDPMLHSIANELRNKTYAVKLGFLTYEGLGTFTYGGSFEQAWNAYQDYQYQDAASFMQLSQDASIVDRHQSQRASSFLLSTVMFAFGTVVTAAGLNVFKQSIRRKLLLLSIAVLVISLIFLLSVIFGLGV